MPRCRERCAAGGLHPRRARAAPARRARSGASWRESFRHPEFWALSSWLDIIVRARKSRFGVLWLLAPSVIYVFGLGQFFRGMQSGRPGDFFVHVALGRDGLPHVDVVRHRQRQRLHRQLLVHHGRTHAADRLPAGVAGEIVLRHVHVPAGGRDRPGVVRQRVALGIAAGAARPGADLHQRPVDVGRVLAGGREISRTSASCSATFRSSCSC